MKYVCLEETCNYEGEGDFTIDLKGELCVDIYNIASIFCPYCQNVMAPEEEAVPACEEGSMEQPA